MTTPAGQVAALTVRQQQVMDYLCRFLSMNDQLPPRPTIASAFGWASANAADSVLAALERKGWLCRNEIGNLMLTRLTTGLQAAA
jgi:SOS-response transcriptional repressor LexA